MRLTLNVDTQLLQRSPVELAQPSFPLNVSLGDRAFDLRVLSSSLDTAPIYAFGANPGTLQFVAKSKIANAYNPQFSGTTIVSGSVDVTSETPSSPQILNCSEDWKAAALVALFGADTPAVTLFGQYRWRYGASPALAWSRTRYFPVAVANSLFADDFIPSAQPVGGERLYLGNVTAYVGADATALDHNLIANLPAGTILDVVVNGVLASWKKVAGTDNTNLGNGVIKTIDFDAVTMPFVLVRVAGN